MLGRCEQDHFAFRPYVAGGAWEARPHDACPQCVDTRTPATYFCCPSTHEVRPSILRAIKTERLAPRIRSLVNAGKRRPHVGVDDTLPASPLRHKKKIPAVSSRSGPPSMLAIKAWKGCRCAVECGGLPLLLLNRGEDVQSAQVGKTSHMTTTRPGLGYWPGLQQSTLCEHRLLAESGFDRHAKRETLRPCGAHADEAGPGPCQRHVQLCRIGRGDEAAGLGHNSR